MLKLCAENLNGIVSEETFIEIAARMIKAASKVVSYDQKCLLYKDVLNRLDKAVRETAIKIKKRRHINAYTSSQKEKN